jgi:hypothetical protein
MTDMALDPTAPNADRPEESDDPLVEAGRVVTVRAAAYAPWALAIFAVATTAYAWEEILQPILWSLSSDGYYPMSRALGHVRGNLETSMAAIPLLWALWELTAFLRGLAHDGPWRSDAGARLTRVGFAVILASVVAMLVTPAMAGLPDARDAKPWPFDPIHLALVGIGLVLVLVARLLQIAVRTVQRLKQENDQFI